MVVFIAMCDGFLGIDPHFDLWSHFFSISLVERRERDWPEQLTPMGCASIHLKNNRSGDYLPMRLSLSNN